MSEQDNLYYQALVNFYQSMQDWFNGSAPDTDERFTHTIGVVAEDNTYINADGTLHLNGKQYLHGMRQAHGQMPGFKMWIEDFRLIWEDGNLVLVTYKEWSQRSDTQPRGLRSTAIFRKIADNPNGVEWLHYQETPLSDKQT